MPCHIHQHKAYGWVDRGVILHLHGALEGGYCMHILSTIREYIWKSCDMEGDDGKKRDVGWKSEDGVG